jgi:hypothetical protein
MGAQLFKQSRTTADGGAHTSSYPLGDNQRRRRGQRTPGLPTLNAAMRRAALLTAVLLLAACGEATDDGTAAPTPRTDVRVTHDRDGARGNADARTVRLRCPSRRHRAACRRLTSLPLSAFRRLPRDTICTEIYGGPQTGRIRGVVRGRRVDARYERTNGCHIARYDRVAPVLAVTRR